MTHKSFQSELFVNITVRGDVAAIHAFAIDSDESTSGAERLNDLLSGIVNNRQQEWGDGASYQLDDILLVHTDSLPKILEQTNAGGHFVEVMDQADLPQLQRAVPSQELSGLSTDERDLVHAVQQHAQGQIIVPPCDAVDTITTLTRTFPQENVLVVGASDAAVGRILRALRERSDRPVSTGPLIPWNQQPLVHVESLSGSVDQLTTGA